MLCTICCAWILIRPACSRKVMVFLAFVSFQSTHKTLGCRRSSRISASKTKTLLELYTGTNMCTGISGSQYSDEEPGDEDDDLLPRGTAAKLMRFIRECLWEQKKCIRLTGSRLARHAAREITSARSLDSREDSLVLPATTSVVSVLQHCILYYTRIILL